MIASAAGDFHKTRSTTKKLIAIYQNVKAFNMIARILFYRLFFLQGGNVLKLLAILFGTAGSLGGLSYCGFLLLKNPYVNGSPSTDVIISFILLFFIPLIMALFASLFFKPILLLISFVWSLPISLYLLGTPGLFNLVIIFPLLILVGGIMMFTVKKALPSS